MSIRFPFPNDKAGFLFAELHEDKTAGPGQVGTMRFKFLIRRAGDDRYAFLYNDDSGLCCLPEYSCKMSEALPTLPRIFSLTEELAGFSTLRAEPVAYIIDAQPDQERRPVLPHLYILADVDDSKPCRLLLPDACELRWGSLAQMAQEVESSIFQKEHPDVTALHALLQNKLFPVVENWR